MSTSEITDTIFCQLCRTAIYPKDSGYACVKIKCPNYGKIITPENIIDDLKQFPSMDAAYYAKMMHYVPEGREVNRVLYILEHCKNKRVLNLGSASGELHAAIVAVAFSVVGVDKDPPADLIVNLDEDPNALGSPDVDIVVAGEILEHLANPGNCLKALRKIGKPLLLTAPNAGALALGGFLKMGYENVNPDHVAWYSYTTLKRLLERYQFEIEDFAWYHGKPRFAEGLVVLAR